MSKKYGLIKPGSEPKANFARPSVFGSDSSSDDDKKPQKIGLGSAIQKKQAKLLQEKALEEDPTVYQYDELYDDISAKKQEEKAKKSEDQKPKYIQRLLQTAERRKIENERRIERKVQKEREEEGEMYKDKEAFVTSSYRKKLEELRKAEEEEEREAYLESIGDVRKQGNLDGFYRHIFEQKTDKDVQVPVKPEIPKPSESSEKDPKKRSYRKKKTDEMSDEETNMDEAIKVHLQNNLDADSDFSIDSSSEDDDDDEEKVKMKSESPEFVKPSEDFLNPGLNVIPPPAPASASNGKSEEKPQDEDVVEVPSPPKKVKVDIWKKRTVGTVFDDALQRYYERKALREQMV